MDETASSMSRDVNFLAVICQTNVPNDLLLWVFCFDEKTRVNEVESFFSEQTILLRGEGSSIKSVSSEAMIQVIIDGLDVPSERHGLKLRYLKGQVFQDSSLIVRNVVNHIPQLVFKLDQSGEILSTVTLAPTKETSKQVTATDDLASIVMEASPVVKQGVPTDNELEDLNRNIGIKWKQLGHRLSFSDEELQEIDMKNMLLYQKANQMLKEWKNRNGFHATYQTLYAALSHKFVSRKDLAEKYCTFKKGVPTDDELEVISRKIANEWERLACRLSFSYKELQEIDLDKRHLSEKAYQMLKEWKNRNGFNATYKTLYAALSHKFVSRKDLAEKYFKQGVPTDDELEDLGQNIGDKWEQLGRRLSFSDEGLRVIDLDKRLLSQKALQVLKEWKKRNGSDATYQTLYPALSHRLVSRKDLAEKYFKQGVPTDYELEDLSQNIGNEWEQLGRRLSFSSKELQEIDLDIKHLSKKAYQMLKQWKNRNGSNATYQTLYAALNHGFVSVEQEEESGSATKIHRLNPVKEPGTLTLSSTSKTKKGYQALRLWSAINGSPSTEVEEDEECSLTAKKPKVDPVELDTSGVSIPSRAKKVKKGSPSTEVEEDEECNVTAKKPKVDPVELETSGVSISSRKTKKVKKDVEREERENEDDPKAKKRQEVFPKLREGLSTDEESEESINLHVTGPAQRDAGNGSRPSTSGAALSLKTERFELAINDVWSLRMLMTPIVAVGGALAYSLPSLLLSSREVVVGAIQVALHYWGAKVSGVKPGSIIVDMNFESEEDLLKFKEDLENGKVKDAMEKEFSNIGISAKLQLTLQETPHVTMMKKSKKKMTQEEEEIIILNPNPAVFDGGKKAEKEKNQKAEAREDPRGADNLNKEDFQPTSQKSKEGDERKLAGCVSQQPSTSASGSSQTKWPSDKELLQIASRIADHWEQVGINLNIPNAQIERIKLRGKEAPFQMLVAWKKNIKCVHPYKTLYDVLCSEGVDLSSVADEFLLGKI